MASKIKRDLLKCSIIRSRLSTASLHLPAAHRQRLMVVTGLPRPLLLAVHSAIAVPLDSRLLYNAHSRAKDRTKDRAWRTAGKNSSVREANRLSGRSL